MTKPNKWLNPDHIRLMAGEITASSSAFTRLRIMSRDKVIAMAKQAVGAAVSKSIIQPKRPNGMGWEKIHNPNTAQLDALGFPHETWWHKVNSVMAISAVEVTHDPGQPPLGPEYHLSLSANGQRLSAADSLWALAQFDLTDAKEDNHVPSGRVRNFWRPVADHLSGYECPCVDDEPAIRENKGDFVWRGLS